VAFRSPMAALRSLAVGLLRSLEVALLHTPAVGLLHTPAVGPARTAAAAAARRTPDGSWPVDDGAVVGSVCRLACRVHRPWAKVFGWRRRHASPGERVRDAMGVVRRVWRGGGSGQRWTLGITRSPGARPAAAVALGSAAAARPPRAAAARSGQCTSTGCPWCGGGAGAGRSVDTSLPSECEWSTA